MNIKHISVIAKNLGIAPKKHNKSQLIHLIQQAEGNFPCYATANAGECDQLDCLWRLDCLKTTVTQH